MLKKILIYLILFSFLHLAGCYSTEIVSPNQYKEYEFSDGNSSYILVKMNNLKEYRFAKGKYSIKADSLYGNGFERVNDNYQPFNGTIPISQIESIQYEEKNTAVTILLVAGIVAGVVIIIASLAWKANKDRFRL